MLPANSRTGQNARTQDTISDMSPISTPVTFASNEGFGFDFDFERPMESGSDGGHGNEVEERPEYCRPVKRARVNDDGG